MNLSNLSDTKSQRGFTLIELLVVISIISILAVVVFVALDPATRFADARNSRRWSGVNNILTAVHECVVDNGGSFATCGLTDNNQYQIGTCATGADTLCTGAQTACLDLDADTDLDPYLKSFPLDPNGGSAATTGFAVDLDANNIVTVTACSAENGETIAVSR